MEMIAGDKGKPLSWSPRCYYTCIAGRLPPLVWTSSKIEWNAQNAIWSHTLGHSITLLSDHTCWLSLTWKLCQVHPAQWWSKIVLTFDCCCPHSIEVTSELVVLKGFSGQWHPTNLPGWYGILLALPSDTLCHAVLTRWWEKNFQKRIKITMDLKMMIDSYSWYNQQKATKGDKSHDLQNVMPIIHFNDSDTTLKLWEFNI